jgi:hypothetical protein
VRALTALLVVALAGACGGDDGDGMLVPDGGPGGPDGPDGGEPATDADPASDIAAIPPGCLPARATSDRPDDHGFDQIRVLYVLPSDVADLARDTNGQICNSVRAFATWFHGRAGSYLRFDTQGGLVDIGFVRLTKTDAQMRGSDPNNTSVATGTAFVRNRIELELKAMGHIRSNKLYAVYYEGSSSYACGGGAWPPLIVDRVGAMYLRGLPPGQSVFCGDSRPWGTANLVPNYIDYGMLHELVHSLGFAPAAAPNEHSSGHVYDATVALPARDLMYSPRPGQPDPGWNIDHPDGLVLDFNSDDYFGTGNTLDLSRSTLLAPLPAGARRPFGW